MRALGGLALLLVTACTSILGIHEIEPTGDEGTVHGTAIDRRYESPTKVSPVPEDLTGYVLQAYAGFSPATGFQVIDGSGNADGTFSLPGVPDGAYYLLVLVPNDPIPHFYQTSSRTIDLGITTVGRRDTPAATVPTTLALHLTGLTAQGGLLYIDSFSTGRPAFFNVINESSTTLDEVLDWNHSGTPLLDASRSDDVFVSVAQPTLTTPLLTTAITIADAYSTQGVTLVAGQSTPVSGAFTHPAADQHYTYRVDIPSYLQGLDVINRRPITTSTRLRVGFAAGLGQSAPLLDVRVTSGPGDPTPGVNQMYADPFPAAWQRYVSNGPGINATYTPRGSARTVDLAMSTFEQRPISGDAFPSFAPLFAAPGGIKVNGLAANRALAVPFASGAAEVLVEWTPVVGVGHYLVTVSHLIDDGAKASALKVATFDTAEPRVQMPPMLFKEGEAYVVGVSAVADPSSEYDQGALRRQGFPYARREAVTARILFATSCGNNRVDAAYEECDTGSVETATCNADCTVPRCGDGVLNTAAGEACDDAGDSLTCDGDCTLRSCGDGHINTVAGEACDDGNPTGGDGCSATCAVEPGFVCTGMPSVCTHP